MADDIQVLDGSAGLKTIAADEIGGKLFVRQKLIHGADGTNDGDISEANGLPVQPSRMGNCEALVTIAHGSITGSFASMVLSNIATSVAVELWNDTNGILLFSWDGGTTTHHIMPAKSSRTLRTKDGATQLHVKFSTDPDEGNLYAEVVR